MSATEDLYRSYLDLRWHFDPTQASAAGLTSHDGRLGDFSGAAMRTHLAAFKAIASAAEQLEVNDQEEEIDRTAFLDEVRTTIIRFERERPQMHQPGFWLGHLFRGLHLLLQHRHGSPAERAAGILGRLQAIPWFLRTARETLREPPAIFLETASEIARNGGHLLGEAGRAAGEAAPELADPLEDALAEAEAALGRFVLALHSELNAHPDELSFAIGEDLFNRRLHHEHALQPNAPELYRYGLHLAEEVEAELTALARQIDPRVDWRSLAARLRDTGRPGCSLTDAFRESMHRGRGFLEARDLVRLPEGDLEVIDTPGFLRPLLPFAAYDAPPAYAPDRTGTFYVTPSAPGTPESSLPCLHEIASLAVHEAWPGHHLQCLTAQSLDSEVRRTLWTPVLVEGWALYGEELMAEEGFFASLEERLFQRVHLLWRALRVVLDIGLHTRGLTPDQATETLVGRLGMDRGTARKEVSRYCATPTYQLCYAVGRREILHLREAWRLRAGAAAPLREFHDALLGYGGLPVSLSRWGMGLGIDE